MLKALKGLEVIKNNEQLRKRITDNEYYGVIATLLCFRKFDDRDLTGELPV